MSFDDAFPLFFPRKKEERELHRQAPNPFFSSFFFMGSLMIQWFFPLLLVGISLLWHNHYIPSALNTLNNGGKDALTLHKENCIFTKWGHCYHLDDGLSRRRKRKGRSRKRVNKIHICIRSVFKRIGYTAAHFQNFFLGSLLQTSLYGSMWLFRKWDRKMINHIRRISKE